MGDNPSSSADPAIVLRVTSFWGPLARGAARLRPARVLVSNGVERLFSVAAARISLLASERSGLVAAGSLIAEASSEPVPPGGAIRVAITGTVPASPGAYKAQLDLDGEDGGRISAPLRIEVAAKAIWGALCLLLGLSLLGLIKFLSREGDVEELARHAILERAAIQADWAIHPPPAGRLEMVARIDQDFDDALRSLAKPRGLSVIDRRIADANASLASAHEAANKLREAAGSPPGALETADLEREWEEFKSLAKALATPSPVPSQAAPASHTGSTPYPFLGAPGGQDLATHVRDFVEGARAGIVAWPAEAYVAGLEPHVERVKLALAAGEDEQAREMAVAARQWIHRAADDLGKRQTLTIGLAALGAKLVAVDARLRRIAEEDESVSPEARAKWITSLDAADAEFASSLTLQHFERANELVADVETQSMRDQNAALKAALPARLQAAGDTLSLDAVTAAFAKMGPPDQQRSDSEYFSGMMVVFAAWRGSLSQVRDDPARKRMQAAANSGADAAARQDRKGIRQAYDTLKSEWNAYTPKHVALAAVPVVAPVCARWRDEVMRELAATNEQIRLESERPEFSDWDKRLDGARLALLAVSPGDSNCIGAVADANKLVLEVSKAAFDDMLKNAGIPADAKLDAAKRSGDAATVALVETLMTEPRDMKLGLAGEAGPVVDQPAVFELPGRDPNWGPGIDIAVEWGDNETLRTDAQTLRPGERLEHVYRTIGTFEPRVTASLGGKTVGVSALKVTVNASPASPAERLADIFLTSQFWLALLIASVVYFWRFHSGAVIFGSQALHYVQAFALGFAAYAAIADLPKALADLVLK